MRILFISIFSWICDGYHEVYKPLTHHMTILLQLTQTPVKMITNMCQCNAIVADWPTGQSLFLMSHPDDSLVKILQSTTRVSLVQNKFVFCQLRVHYIGDPDITKTYLGIQHVNILQYLHELNGNVHYINISNVPTLNCAACSLQRFNRDERSAVREQWIRPIRTPSV